VPVVQRRARNGQRRDAGLAQPVEVLVERASGAFQEFGPDGRMKASPYYDRIVDVMEELVRFTLLVRPHAAELVDRYSERQAAGTRADAAADLASLALARQKRSA